jgi:thioredoxin reductase (NADPH)
VTAVGDGVVAACAAEKYIAEEEHYNTLIVKPEKPVAVLVYNAVEKESQNCLLMFKDIEAEFKDVCAFVRLDVYKSSGMAKRLGVATVPAFVLVKEGRIIDMCCSDVSTGAMKNMLKSHL